ncbi:MAG: septum formation protein Maf [Candidatus Latescibacteria bacterium]|nr:septum formation protein Maf [bacterium]MBD3424420.1 septum formation protein Maf [Candidatus Latescibacterota bacterium]
MQEDLVLASASPRRRKILSDLDFEYIPAVSSVKEDEVIWEEPRKRARVLAELKAVDVQSDFPSKRIIGADTVVECDGRRLDKPADENEAADMLRFLSGRTHTVITALALVSLPNHRKIELESTSVIFRELNQQEIESYISTGECFDKAGAYGIQGYGAALVEAIEGCFYNVVGMPVNLLIRMLREFAEEQSD